MSKALAKRPERSFWSGAVPAVASGVIPGLGQLINKDSNKALGVFAVWAVAGLSVVGAIPVVGSAAALVGAGTWVYGVADGYYHGRRRR